MSYELPFLSVNVPTYVEPPPRAASPNRIPTPTTNLENKAAAIIAQTTKHNVVIILPEGMLIIINKNRIEIGL